jgi:hypothetical protein
MRSISFYIKYIFKYREFSEYFGESNLDKTKKFIYDFIQINYPLSEISEKDNILTYQIQNSRIEENVTNNF